MASDVVIGDETVRDRGPIETETARGGIPPGNVRLIASALPQDNVAVIVNVKRLAREPKPGSGPPPDSAVMNASALPQDSVAVIVNVKRLAREPKPDSGPPLDSAVMKASALRRGKAEIKDSKLPPNRETIIAAIKPPGHATTIVDGQMPDAMVVTDEGRAADGADRRFLN